MEKLKKKEKIENEWARENIFHFVLSFFGS